MDNDKKVKKSFSRMITTVVLSSVFILLLVFTIIPIFAWYYTGKDVYSYAPISTPESLYIGTGHEEDIRYLDISGIDLESDGYKEYVISVKGKGLASYGIQIGYTTNNTTVSYSIYYATEHALAELTDEQIEALNLSVQYTDLEDEVFGYSKTTGIAIPLQQVKTKDAADVETTYGEYTTIDTGAKPLYYQTEHSISVSNERALAGFVDYFILRISWTASSNNRETDILCIAAKGASY